MQSIMKTKFNISISKKESFYSGIVLLILATIFLREYFLSIDRSIKFRSTTLYGMDAILAAGGFFFVGAALFFTSLKISKTTKEK